MKEGGWREGLGNSGGRRENAEEEMERGEMEERVGENEDRGGRGRGWFRLGW